MSGILLWHLVVNYSYVFCSIPNLENAKFNRGTRVRFQFLPAIFWISSHHRLWGLQMLRLVSLGRQTSILCAHLWSSCLATWSAHLHFSCVTSLRTSVTWVHHLRREWGEEYSSCDFRRLIFFAKLNFVA